MRTDVFTYKYGNNEAMREKSEFTLVHNHSKDEEEPKVLI